MNNEENKNPDHNINIEEINIDDPAKTQLLDISKLKKDKDNIKNKKENKQENNTPSENQTANKENPINKNEMPITRSKIINPNKIYQKKNNNNNKNLFIIITIILLAIAGIIFFLKTTNKVERNEKNIVTQKAKISPKEEKALIKKVMEETKPVVNTEQPYFKAKGNRSFSSSTSFTDKEGEKFKFTSLEEDRKTITLIEGFIELLTTIDSPSIKKKNNILNINESNYKIIVQNKKKKRIVKFYIDKKKYLFIINNQITKISKINAEDISSILTNNHWTWEIEEDTENQGYKITFNNKGYITNEEEINLINNNGCSFYSLGMNKNDIKNKSPKGWKILSRNENHKGKYVNILKVTDTKGGTPLFFMNEDKNEVQGFYIFSNLFRNNKGIRKGASVKQCLLLYPEIGVTCSPQGNTYIQLPGEDNVRYLIDKKYVSFKNDTIDENAKIISIFIGNSPFLK